MSVNIFLKKEDKFKKAHVTKPDNFRSVRTWRGRLEELNHVVAIRPVSTAVVVVQPVCFYAVVVTFDVVLRCNRARLAPERIYVTAVKEQLH